MTADTINLDGVTIGITQTVPRTFAIYGGQAALLVLADEVRNRMIAEGTVAVVVDLSPWGLGRAQVSSIGLRPGFARITGTRLAGT